MTGSVASSVVMWAVWATDAIVRDRVVVRSFEGNGHGEVGQG